MFKEGETSRDLVSLLGIQYKRINPEYLSSGDIIWVPDCGIQDALAYILVEHFSEDRYYGLVNMIGHKAGRKYVAFPNECFGKDRGSFPIKWLSENWEKWVALGNFDDAIILRLRTKILS